MDICFLDNGLLDKWTFFPMGQFSDYWGFRIIGHCNNGMELYYPSSNNSNTPERSSAPSFQTMPVIQVTLVLCFQRNWKLILGLQIEVISPQTGQARSFKSNFWEQRCCR